jgi:murein DD-endopeptidase MepM/ murein hydrolase activator NlpD
MVGQGHPRWIGIGLALVIASTAAAEDDIDDGEAGCDASAGGEVDELVEDQPVDVTRPTPVPIVWRESRGRQCRRHRGRRACDGPRRVPEPFGPAAELAASLGLDESRVPRTLMAGPAPAAWVQAAGGQPGPGLLWPVPDGRLGRGLGRHRPMHRPRGARGRRMRVMHNGVDIMAPEGALIRAVNDGLVAYSFNGMTGYGNSVLLLHGDGTISLYAHCRATYVFAGQRVRRGQVLGEVGDTGLARGTHLHFEWRRDGQPLDPIPHFVDRPQRSDDAEEPDVADEVDEP